MEIVLIVISVIFLIFVILFLFLNSYVKGIHKSIMGRRYDDNGTLHYFSCDDYKDINLKRREGDLFSDEIKLKYYIYENDQSRKDVYILLSHGLGAGHVQYMEEIAYFVKNGFQVVTYDVRGCYGSSGNGIGSFSDALKDLHNVLSHVESVEEFKDRKVLLYGHSMGGFCVNNIAIYNHKNIIGVTSVSSFNSVDVLFGDMVEAIGGKYLSFVGKMLANIEKKNSVNELTISIESLKQVQYPVLMISGDKDDVVFPDNNFFEYERVFKNNPMFTFKLVKDRFHRPNLTLESALYCKEVDKMINEYNALKKKDKSEFKKKALYDSFDYRKMVELDEGVMLKVLTFYDNCIKNDTD